MRREIVRAANPTERAILEPHVERLRAYLATVAALSKDPALKFDPDHLVWFREIEDTPDG